MVKYPFRLEQLPLNGIYFFYEEGETVDHGDGVGSRMVRIGTHKDGNFRSRIAEHFLMVDEAKKMAFDENKPAPHERSIFRKNLGRALLNKAGDPYLEVWELDFTTSAGRKKNKHRRDVAKEKAVEAEVTRLLREKFSFRFILLEGQEGRMGSSGLESNLIGTVAKCEECKPSANWLGNYSPKEDIRRTGLWLAQHLKSPEISEGQRGIIEVAIKETQDWIRQHP
jgi:hypothetical protein